MRALCRFPRIVGFDMEFASPLPSDWSVETSAARSAEAEAEVHILCAGIVTFSSTGAIASRAFHSPDKRSPMPYDVVRQVVDALYEYTHTHWSVVTWGGTASDFRVLHAQCLRHGDFRRARMVRTITLRHYDVPLCTASTSGHMMGLSAVCQAMGVPLDKKPGDSRDIASHWLADPDHVIRHVLADAWSTVRVFDVSSNQFPEPRIHWVTRTNAVKQWSHPLYLNVFQCMGLPAWGAHPSHRSSYVPKPPRDRESNIRWLRRWTDDAPDRRS